MGTCSHGNVSKIQSDYYIWYFFFLENTDIISPLSKLLGAYGDSQFSLLYQECNWLPAQKEVEKKSWPYMHTMQNRYSCHLYSSFIIISSCFQFFSNKNTGHMILFALQNKSKNKHACSTELPSLWRSSVQPRAWELTCELKSSVPWRRFIPPS